MDAIQFHVNFRWALSLTATRWNLVLPILETVSPGVKSSDTITQCQPPPSYLPSGFHALTVHLTVKGAVEYIEFLKRTLGGVELTRSALPDGRLLNARLFVGLSHKLGHAFGMLKRTVCREKR